MPLAFPGSAQDILDLEAAGTLPNGVGVTRNQADVPIVVRSSYGNTGREVISGLDVSLAGAWETDWADVGLKLHWLHRADYEAWHAGTRLPGHRPRNSAHGTLRAGRGDITASWSVHARSGYANSRGTGRFGSWIGHDLGVDVRNPFGLSGASLAAGVINVGNEGPSVDSANPQRRRHRPGQPQGAHILPDPEGGVLTVRRRAAYLSAAVTSLAFDQREKELCARNMTCTEPNGAPSSPIPESGESRSCLTATSSPPFGNVPPVPVAATRPSSTKRCVTTSRIASWRTRCAEWWREELRESG